MPNQPRLCYGLVMEPDEDDNRIELDREAREAADSRNWLRECFAKIRNDIPERDALVMDMRFGFGEFEGQQNTLEDVAKKFNITRERVRQIDQKTLARIKYLSLDQP